MKLNEDFLNILTFPWLHIFIHVYYFLTPSFTSTHVHFGVMLDDQPYYETHASDFSPFGLVCDCPGVKRICGGNQ